MPTRSDLDRLLYQFNQPKTTSQKVKSGLILIVQFAVLFIFFFSILNFPAYYQRLGYFYRAKIRQQAYANPTSTKVSQVLQSARALPTIADQPDQPTPSQTWPSTPTLPDNHLYIPKINVDAPIIWQVDPAVMLEKLRAGITHYNGTSLPGQSGNVVITGHSSNFWWDPGQYKQVFALLDQLAIGDKIVLTSQKQFYIYEVEKTLVVNPGQIEVLNPTDHSILTLLTCTPVGTTINRLIVQAKQIQPIAGSVENIPPLPDQINELPAIR